MTSISNLEAHGVPVTAHGGPLETTVPVYDADQLRSLLDLGLDEAGREAHYQALFGGVAPAASDAVSKLSPGLPDHRARDRQRDRADHHQRAV
jgi:hypothetical protein